MDWQELLRNSTVLENLCLNLTFEEVVELRTILRLEEINCEIPIIDDDHQVSSLNKVNSLTIQAYNYIQKYGSDIAMLRATSENKYQLVQTLLENGADPDAYDIFFEYTPLMRAAKFGYDNIIELLLNYDANVDAVDKENITPLLYAIDEKKVSTVKLLLENDADIEDESEIGTPLMAAIDKENLEIIAVILKHSTPEIINHRDHKNGTALMRAAKYGMFSVVKDLVDHGAIKYLTDDNGKTAGSFAEEYFHFDIANYLE